ncbi:MAG TPA: hypothetical protein VGK58_16690 [Lacipirellulaceae bacterium]
MSSTTPGIAFKNGAANCTLISLAACLFAGVTFAAETLEVAREYKDGGGYDNSWKGTGVPEEIRFKNERILAKGKGTYCCGFTFAIAMEVSQERSLLDDKRVAEIRAFQKQWYGATEESREIQCAMAVEKLGIGKRIDPDEARPGDFLQFWRTNKSGHSVVFVEWVEKDGRRVGFKYRSSQGSTKGIGDRVEYFADADRKEGLVDRQRMYFCRLDDAPKTEQSSGL